jgi:hypothetical protein
MRNHRWMLVVIAVLIGLNLAFFAAVHSGALNRWAQKQVTTYLTRSLKTPVEIGAFDFNDRQINVFRIKVTSPDSSVTVEIPRLYITYNLLKLLLSRVNLGRVFERVEISHPVIRLDLAEPDPPKKNPSPTILPDFSKYFRSLEINDGVCVVAYHGRKFTVRDSIAGVGIKIRSGRTSEIDCVTADGVLDASAAIRKGKLVAVDIHLNGFRPDSLATVWTQSLAAELRLRATFHDQRWRYDGAVSHLTVSAQGRNAAADSLIFRGDADLVDVSLDELRVDGDSLGFNARIPLRGGTPLRADVAARVTLERLVPDIAGQARTRIRVSGDFSKPQAAVKVSGTGIVAGGQTIDNVRIEGAATPKGIDVTALSCLWNGDPVTGSGVIEDWRRVRMSVQAQELHRQLDGFAIKGAMTGEVDYRADSLRISTEFHDLSAQGRGISLRRFSGEARFDNGRLEASLLAADNSLALSLQGNLRDSTGTAVLRLDNCRIDSLLHRSDLTGTPRLGGEIKLSGNPENWLVNGRISTAGRSDLVSGTAYLTLACDTRHDRTLFHVKTYNARFRGEPLELNLLGGGSLDSLHTSIARLNREIDLELRAGLHPVPYFGFHVRGSELSLARYLRYTGDRDPDAKGLVDLDLSWNLDDQRLAKGEVHLVHLQFDGLRPIDAAARFQGPLDRLTGRITAVLPDSTAIAETEVRGSIFPTAAVEGQLVLPKVDLAKMFDEGSGYAGIIEGRIGCRLSDRESAADIDLSAHDLFIGGMRLDSLRVLARQENERLLLDSLSAGYSRIRCSGHGALGYNFLANRIYPDSARVRLNLNGDLLGAVSDHFSFLRQGRSRFNAQVELTVGDEGLEIPRASISLRKGRLLLPSQLDPVDNITLQIDVTDNVLRINEFKARSGNGYLHIYNVIDSLADEDSEFRLGRLRLGNFRIYTDPDGILAHIPSYTPAGSQAEAVVMGRIAPNADLWNLDPAANPCQINGPFDDIHMIGDAIFSNGSIIYPSNTRNLLDLVGKSARRRYRQTPEEPAAQLPFTADFWLHIRDNVRYTTYPADFVIEPGSNMQLTYTDDWHTPEIDLHSQKGTFDIFGTTFSVDNVTVSQDPINREASLYSKMTRHVQDGSTVTLQILPMEGAANNLENLQIKLTSDTGETSVLDILSKLRYGRSHDQLSQSQQQALLQDEAIDLAGVQLETSLVHPFISPLEKTIRKRLDLDFFYVKPGFIRNLIFEYAGNDPTRGNMEIFQFGAGILLNNMSVDAGKYITRDLFLDYTLLIQEATDIRSKQLVANHDFSLRYDLPHQFKLGYTFSIDRVNGRNSHEIMLQRSFRF